MPRVSRISLALGLALAFLVALVIPLAPASATSTEPTLLPLNSSGTPYWNSLATWNPSTSQATLCPKSALLPMPRPDRNWMPAASACLTWSPETFQSGVYEVAWGAGNLAVLVISDKSEHPAGGIAVIVPDYTWQAYNNVYGSFYQKTRSSDKYAPKVVNLFRPLWRTDVTADPIQFLRESQSKPIYVIQQSKIDEPQWAYNLKSYDAVVLYGHDEYWTPKVSTSIIEAVQSGTALLNLSGNTGFRQINRSGSNIVYSSGASPPRWRDVARPFRHDSLLAGTFLYRPFGGDPRTSAALKNEYDVAKRYGAPGGLTLPQAIQLFHGFRVLDPNSPLFAGMSVTRGQWLCPTRTCMGVELDGIPLDKHGNPWLEVLRTMSTKPQIAGETWTQPWHLPWMREPYLATHAGVLTTTTYGRGRVFSAGSITWSSAIVRRDQDARQITLNALNWVLTPH